LCGGVDTCELGRYEGTDTALMTLKPTDDWDFEAAFIKAYKQEFGFILKDKPIIVDDIRSVEF
jgi:5-oxoprolinase (ATP-hydrolysing)